MGSRAGYGPGLYSWIIPSTHCISFLGSGLILSNVANNIRGTSEISCASDMKGQSFTLNISSGRPNITFFMFWEQSKSSGLMSATLKGRGEIVAMHCCNNLTLKYETTFEKEVWYTKHTSKRTKKDTTKQKLPFEFFNEKSPVFSHAILLCLQTFLIPIKS